MKAEENKTGIYIHIPFCVKKCRYCDFTSYCTDGETHRKYIDRLCGEIKSYDGIKTADTVFFGGGTPSCIDPCLIEKVMDTVRSKFSLHNCEITLEANPGTVTPYSAKLYKTFGINRISMGVQSHNEKILKFAGRIHLFGDFLKSLEYLRNEGIDNINADLMFSMPFQTPEIWLDTLEKVISAGVEHISAYGLIIEENTPFFDMYQKKEFVPDEETDRYMYHSAVEFLAEKGFKRYEISNFAKKGFECRHNLKYWSGENYIGFGAAASSYNGITRRTNTKSLSEYLSGKTVDYEEYLTEKIKIEEYMFLGLRKDEGIDTLEFKEKFGYGISEIYPSVNEFYREGYISKKGTKIKLTDKGIDVSETIFAEFMF